ncbi:MAG: transcription termination factor NusA [Candidatus Goldiibacteriota bacterium HGW-Goldbacteria-1]|jgi:N utilization substance protein A|nr:MAG: transcription termination factor NusA [Candidatus Goldiibacteriota bacterium HGW-Goldbacteria-1]
MGNEILQMLQQVEKLKNIDEKELIDAFERGITSAAKKVYGIKPEIRVEFGEELKFFWKKTVVEKASNDFTEISLDAAKEIKSDAVFGDIIEVLFYPKEFGRIAAQTTKQVITQKIREVEKEQIFQDTKKKEGEIVTGTVHTIEHGDVVVDLGAVEGVLKVREQVAHEKYRIGERIRALALKTVRGKEGAILELSRTHPNFIKRIFAQEVTEVDQGTVEIKYVAREPGVKTKVVVTSNDSHIDPVGACIGVKGSRIQTIIRELHGEKVDVVLYDEDIKKYLQSAIAPIEIKDIYIDQENHYTIIAVSDEQFSQVIGKNGINMRLVAKITKWKVSVLRINEFNKEKIDEMKGSFEQQVAYDLFKLGDDIPVKQLKELKKAGIKNLLDFETAGIPDIINVLGCDEKTAEKLKEKAQALIEKEEQGE